MVLHLPSHQVTRATAQKCVISSLDDRRQMLERGVFTYRGGQMRLLAGARHTNRRTQTEETNFIKQMGKSESNFERETWCSWRQGRRMVNK